MEDCNNFNEYMRHLLNERLTYDDKSNFILYYKDLNVINAGNYFNYLFENDINKNNSQYYNSDQNNIKPRKNNSMTNIISKPTVIEKRLLISTSRHIRFLYIWNMGIILISVFTENGYLYNNSKYRNKEIHKIV